LDLEEEAALEAESATTTPLGDSPPEPLREECWLDSSDMLLLLDVAVAGIGQLGHCGCNDDLVWVGGLLVGQSLWRLLRLLLLLLLRDY